MKYLHPFPARMAPDLLDDILSTTKTQDTLFDPMSGSGMVLTKALSKGMNAIGLDMDPLAVLLSRTVVNTSDMTSALRDIDKVLASAQNRTCGYASLPWLRDCDETKEFISYWFAPQQSGELAKAISEHRFATAQNRRLALIALSRTIITKHVGASLAWDISHSRPHIKKTTNEYDVFNGFNRAARAAINVACENKPLLEGKVYKADARLAHRYVRDVDHIITSPPYLNAIDYLRGHKFSLIWMGHTIPELRQTRSSTVGAERSADTPHKDDLALLARRTSLHNLPKRQMGHLTRYVGDLRRLASAFAKCLREDGTLTAVIGNSTLRDTYIPNSDLFRAIAEKTGFELKEKYTRRIDARRRYLPESDSGKSLDKRMRKEVVLLFRRTRLRIV